jgi:hypothetical protein
MGEMADLFDDVYWNYEYDDQHDEDESRFITCKHCGDPNLHWAETKEGWRTFEASNKVHVCPAFTHVETGRAKVVKEETKMATERCKSVRLALDIIQHLAYDYCFNRKSNEPQDRIVTIFNTSDRSYASNYVMKRLEQSGVITGPLQARSLAMKSKQDGFVQDVAKGYLRKLEFKNLSELQSYWYRFGNNNSGFPWTRQVMTQEEILRDKIDTQDKQVLVEHDRPRDNSVEFSDKKHQKHHTVEEYLLYLYDWFCRDMAKRDKRNLCLTVGSDAAYRCGNETSFLIELNARFRKAISDRKNKVDAKVKPIKKGVKKETKTEECSDSWEVKEAIRFLEHVCKKYVVDGVTTRDYVAYAVDRFKYDSDMVKFNNVVKALVSSGMFSEEWDVARRGPYVKLKANNFRYKFLHDIAEGQLRTHDGPESPRKLTEFLKFSSDRWLGKKK